MAITKQLKDEADRTIAGIMSYYAQHGDSLIDAEEQEHRISKVVAALEGCNGLTEKEKLQKTAENLFGLTCAWERDSLALKRELIKNREATEKAFDRMDKKIDELGDEIKKISTCYYPTGRLQDTGIAADHLIESANHKNTPWYARILPILDNHFGTFVTFTLIFLLFLILSGNLSWLSEICGR